MPFQTSRGTVRDVPLILYKRIILYIWKQVDALLLDTTLTYTEARRSGDGGG